MHLGTGGASTRSFVLVPGRSFPSARGHLALPEDLDPDGARFAGISFLLVPNLVHQSRRVCKIVWSCNRVRATAPPARAKYIHVVRDKRLRTCVEVSCRPSALAAILFSLLLIYLISKRIFKSHICCVHIYFLFVITLLRKLWNPNCLIIKFNGII